jgi:DNA-binding NtrC family response regulator
MEPWRIPRVFDDMAIFSALSKIISNDAARFVAESKTILLVDDQPEVGDTIKELIEELGYQVVLCSEAAKALDILATRYDIDLVIADVVMPGTLGGPDIAEFAKEMTGLKTILISGFPHHRMTIDSLGQHDVLLKPFLIEELNDRIRTALDIE